MILEMLCQSCKQWTWLFLKQRVWYTIASFFIPPSCMVVPNREIVNINSFFNISAMSCSIETNISSKDINMDKLRDKSIISSSNFLRNLLVHSDISPILYIDKIEA